MKVLWKGAPNLMKADMRVEVWTRVLQNTKNNANVNYTTVIFGTKETVGIHKIRVISIIAVVDSGLEEVVPACGNLPHCFCEINSCWANHESRCIVWNLRLYAVWYLPLPFHSSCDRLSNVWPEDQIVKLSPLYSFLQPPVSSCRLIANILLSNLFERHETKPQSGFDRARCWEGVTLFCICGSLCVLSFSPCSSGLRIDTCTHWCHEFLGMF